MKKVIFFFWLLSIGWAWVPAFGTDDSGPPSNRISMQKARAIALKKFPGKVKDFEFEIKKDKWVYFFKIAGKDQKFHNIVIDAIMGKIILKTSDPMPAVTQQLPTPSAGKPDQK